MPAFEMGTSEYQAGDFLCKAGRIWFTLCVVYNFYILFKCFVFVLVTNVSKNAWKWFMFFQSMLFSPVLATS